MGNPKDDNELKVANVVLYLALLGSGIYAGAGPEGIYRFSKETYITPGRSTFGLWFLIHLLLLGFIVYQFTDNGKKIIVDRIGWRFPRLLALNLVYVFVRTNEAYFVRSSVVAMAATTVTDIYNQVKKYHGDLNINDKLWIHLPFSLYYGWSTTWINAIGFDMYGIDASTHEAGIFTKCFVFLALVEMTYTLFWDGKPESPVPESTKDDVVASIAVTWSLFAIFEYQRSSAFVHWAAFAFTILSLFGVLKGLQNQLNGRHETRVPDGRPASRVPGS